MARWYFGVLILAGIFYVVSCAPGSLWQDSGVIQYRVWHNDIEGGSGLALSHPLFYILAIGAKYVPLGEFGLRVSLVSAIAAAIAVANVYLLLRLWVGKNLPAVVGAITLAVSHTFWRHGSIAETYNLYAAILIAELIVLLQYCRGKRIVYLYGLGFLNGLAIANHMLGVLPLFCYVVLFGYLLVKKEIGLKHLGLIIVVWIVGALPYEYLIIQELTETGDFFGTMNSAAFGNNWQNDVLNITFSMSILKENVLFLGLNFPTPNIFLFFVGCFVIFKFSPRRVFGNLLVGLAVLFLLFASRYTVKDRYAFFIPFYCLVSIFIGLGCYAFINVKNRKRLSIFAVIFSLLSIPTYLVVPAVAAKAYPALAQRRQVPYRDSYKYFLQPWKTGYRGAGRFANEALGSVEHGAVIYADSTVVCPLLYAQQVHDKRRDVSIVSGIYSEKDKAMYGKMSAFFDEEKVAELLKDKAMYVVSAVKGYCPEFLLDSYDFEPAGVLWRVVERGKVH